MKKLLTCVILLGIASSASAAENFAGVAGSKTKIHYQMQGKILLLEVHETSRAFGWEAKVVNPGKLLTVCREGDNGICIPIRLNKVKWKQAKKLLFVEAGALKKALKFEVVEKNKQITLYPQKNKRGKQQAAVDDSDLPAYNAAWGKNRGFRVGQTLPDIPLYDMEGREVRFSQFLGKQVALYVWASW